MQKESIYSNKIDCQLDYSNKDQMMILFEEGLAISDQSVYRFLEEIFNMPVKFKASNKAMTNLEEIIRHINARFDHPIKNIIIAAGMRKLKNDLLPQRKGMIYMNTIRNYKGFYSALNIILGCCRRNAKFYMVERLYDSILQEWQDL